MGAEAPISFHIFLLYYRQVRNPGSACLAGPWHKQRPEYNNVRGRLLTSKPRLFYTVPPTRTHTGPTASVRIGLLRMLRASLCPAYPSIGWLNLQRQVGVSRVGNIAWGTCRPLEGLSTLRCGEMTPAVGQKWTELHGAYLTHFNPQQLFIQGVKSPSRVLP